MAVLTRDDILHDEGIEPYYGPVFKDQTIVAVEKVRHVGDPVAAVAALSVDAAEEALRLIEVDYEELPAVLDVHQALRSGATLVHDSVQSADFRISPILAEIKPIEGTNVCTHFKLNRGDIQKGFAEADHVFEDTFTLPATQHCFLETHACIASVEPGGRITVWATTQNPFVVRTQLANIFKVPVAKVRVIVPYLGGGYGGKVYPKVEPITVALAQKAGRPVRVVLSREEVFYTITKHAAVIRMKTGVKKDGTLVARECEIHLDTGAYAEIGPRVAKKSGYTAARSVPDSQPENRFLFRLHQQAAGGRISRLRRFAIRLGRRVADGYHRRGAEDGSARAAKKERLQRGRYVRHRRNSARDRPQRVSRRSRQVDWMGFEQVQRFKGSKFKVRETSGAAKVSLA